MSKLSQILAGLGIACIGLSSTCSTTKPKPTLPPEKMADILADIFVADAAVASGYGPIRDSMHAYYYSQIFEIHGITHEEYKKELLIYSESLVQMDSIMQMAERKLKAKGQ
jgi:Domain of unknown function (DUF4296)